MKKRLPNHLKIYVFIGLMIIGLAGPFLYAHYSFAQQNAGSQNPESVVNQSLAQEAAQPSPSSSSGNNGNSGDCWKSAWCWASSIFGSVISGPLLQISSVAMGLAGGIFDIAAFATLNGRNYGPEITIVRMGWEIIRDLTNMVFIFLLLFVAIATILQIESYGAKRLLLKVIIAAVLINFSLVITRAVIDVSNILALQFYNQMAGSGWSLGQRYLQALQPNSIFNAPEGGALGLVNVAVGGFMGAILMIIGAIVLFLGALFLIIRLVGLWLLLIFSPIGIVAAIIGMKQYGNLWWKKLLDYALFAPVYLFCFYLVTALVLSGAVSTMASDLLAAPSSSWQLVNATKGGLSFLFQYLVLIILMIGCIIIAKQSGIYGANAVIKYAKSAAKFAGGYAGRIGLRYTAPRAEKWARGEGIVGKALTTILPFGIGSRVLSGYAALGRASITDWTDSFNKMSAEATQRAISGLGISKEMRAGGLISLINRGELKPNKERGFTENIIEKGVRFLGDSGMTGPAMTARYLLPEMGIRMLKEDMRNPKFLANLKKQEYTPQKIESLKKQKEYEGKTDEYIIESEERLKLLRRAPIENVLKFGSRLTENDELFQDSLKAFTPNHFQELSKRMDLMSAYMQKLIEKYPTTWKTIPELIEKLRKAGGLGAASWASSLSGITTLRQYGFTAEGKKEREARAKFESQARANAINQADTPEKIRQALADFKRQDIPYIDINFTASPVFNDFVAERIKVMAPTEMAAYMQRRDDFPQRLLRRMKDMAAEWLRKEHDEGRRPEGYAAGDENKSENFADFLAKNSTKEMANLAREGVGRNLMGLR